MPRGLPALFLALGVVCTAADEAWEVSFHERGVLVETQDVAGSDYKAFRARATLPATPQEVLTRLRDVESYPQWFPDTLEARLVSDDDGSWSNYVRTDAPWPVKDRDTVYRYQRSEQDGLIRIDIVADPDAVPEYDDTVRVQTARGFWELAAVPGGTAVHWQFHMEPGGNVPGNLANKRLVETPKKALLALLTYFAAH